MMSISQMSFTQLSEVLVNVLAEAQTEIVLFILAICTYQFMFGKYQVPERSATKPSKTSPGSPQRGSPKQRQVAREDGATARTSDELRQASLIKATAAKGHLDEAFQIFEACPKKVVAHYNAMLEACIACGDAAACERLAARAIEAASADVTTYNTLMKVHLRTGDIRSARRIVDDMRSIGLAPNCVTYNELLDATVSRHGDSASAWRIINEMEIAGVKPNRITCSILLKVVQDGKTELNKALAQVDKMSEDMDEVLLSSVLEACIRANQVYALKSILARQRTEKRVRVTSCHAYGSLIRAFGATQDVDGIWATWREMRTNRVELTSITIGCMVEAVVTNVGPQGGHELIREVLEDPGSRSLMNSVIYGSVIKGFSHQKQIESVWYVYKEMVEEGMQLSIVTYNMLVDACARCGEMRRVPDVLVEMSKNGIPLNIITYSSIIKGYCQENRIDRALEVLLEMKRTTSIRADEHTYNTVINGCARQGLYDKGVAILEEMCSSGIKPSNFTLSVLVKLASRGRRVDKAFDLCEELSTKYNLQLNVHVYNNLIQACIGQGALRRAFQVVERMVSQKVALDVRTYTLLLRACIGAHEKEAAAGLLRAAKGLKGTHYCIANAPKSIAYPDGGLPSQLVSETLEGIAKRCGDTTLVAQLLIELKLDSKLHNQLRVQLLQS